VTQNADPDKRVRDWLELAQSSLRAAPTSSC
jgi:hypothetical protein